MLTRRRRAPRSDEKHPSSRLKILEIIENDAIDTFARFALGRPELALGLETLNIRAMKGASSYPLPDTLFPSILGALEGLASLQLSVTEDVFTSRDIIPSLYKNPPGNLQTLYFRGPCSLAFHHEFQEWISAFSKPSFLPKLRTLGFVLDAYEKDDTEPPEEMSAAAKAACIELWEAAEGRGVSVVDFTDQWAQKISFLKPVDARWDDK